MVGASLRELFWDIHTCCDMVCHKTNDYLEHRFLLGPSTSWLHYGVSSNSNQDRHLHGITARDLDYPWEFQGPRVENGKEEHSLPESGRTCMELVPRGQAYVCWNHTVANRWLRVLLQWHHIHGGVDYGCHRPWLSATYCLVSLSSAIC